MPNPEQEVPTIEVGVAGDEMRLWLATEAKRQGEARLIAQAASISALEMRATAILAWSVASVLALSAAASQGHLTTVALAAGPLLLLSALMCVAGLWPQDWHPPGYDFGSLQSMSAASELQLVEQIAAGYEAGIRANDMRTVRFGWLLRFAWLCFLIAPLAGIAGALASAR